MTKGKQHRFSQILIFVLVVGVSVLLISLFFKQFVAFFNAGFVDYSYYWSVGRLIVTGNDPYDQHLLLALQQSLDPRFEVPMSIWYPPWTVLLFAPFALLSYGFSHFLWTVVNIVLLIVATRWIWQIYSPINRKLLLPIFLAVSFTAVIFSLVEGQINFIILLGLAGFVYFIRKNKPFLAGVLITLSTFKPQLLVVFWVCLLLWILYKRQWRVLAGAISVVAVMMAIMFIISPDILSNFFNVLVENPPTVVINVSVYGLIYALFGVKISVLLYLPALIGMIGAVVYFWRKRNTWEWEKQISLLLLVSILCVPYAWLHDEMFFLIPILEVAAIMIRRGRALFNKWIVLAYGLLDLLMYILVFFFAHDQHYMFFFPICFLLLYIAVKRETIPALETPALNPS